MYICIYVYYGCVVFRRFLHSILSSIGCTHANMYNVHCTFQLLKHWSTDRHLPAQHNWPVRRSEIYEHSHTTCTALVTVHCLYPRCTGTPMVHRAWDVASDYIETCSTQQILQRTSCITDRVIFQGERIPAKLTPALPRYRLEQSVITCKLRTRSEHWSICFGNA